MMTAFKKSLAMATLTVFLQTDYSRGTDFWYTETLLQRFRGMANLASAFVIPIGTDVLSTAQFDDVDDGDYIVWIKLLDYNGRSVAVQHERVLMDGSNRGVNLRMRKPSD